MAGCIDYPHLRSRNPPDSTTVSKMTVAQKMGDEGERDGGEREERKERKGEEGENT